MNTAAHLRHVDWLLIYYTVRTKKLVTKDIC